MQIIPKEQNFLKHINSVYFCIFETILIGFYIQFQ